MQHPSNASIANFAVLARGYCSWCEGESLGPDPASQAASWLARLYAAALALPDGDAENDRGLPDLPQPEAGRAKLPRRQGGPRPVRQRRCERRALALVVSSPDPLGPTCRRRSARAPLHARFERQTFGAGLEDPENASSSAFSHSLGQQLAIRR